MANSWLRGGLVAGAALSLSGCVELALIELVGDDETEEASGDTFDCGDYECGDTYDESGTDFAEFDTEDYYTDDPLVVSDATLAGDMGQVRGFSDDEPLHNAYGYQGYSTVEIHARGTVGTEAAMGILEVSGGLDHPDLQPGAHFEFSMYDYTSYGSLDRPLAMDLVGCSGPTEGDWVFDSLADSLEVDVSEGSTEGNLAIDFTATFTAYDETGATQVQTVVGGFETPAAVAQ
jgi:hypothetical protein